MSLFFRTHLYPWTARRWRSCSSAISLDNASYHPSLSVNTPLCLFTVLRYTGMSVHTGTAPPTLPFGNTLAADIASSAFTEDLLRLNSSSGSRLQHTTSNWRISPGYREYGTGSNLTMFEKFSRYVGTKPAVTMVTSGCSPAILVRALTGNSQSASCDAVPMNPTVRPGTLLSVAMLTAENQPTSTWFGSTGGL